MLRADRREKLDSIGFSWNPRAERWDEMFQRLENYSQEHGNCQVPTTDVQLAIWTNRQRRKPPEEPHRREKLNSIGFDWKPSPWEKLFAKLGDQLKHDHESRQRIKDIILGKVNTNLSDREQFVLQKRFGLDTGPVPTLAEIGRHYSVSKQRIGQIEENALLKLRRLSTVL